MGVARRILRNRDEAGHAAAFLVFRAHRVAGALGGDHDDVEIGARLDQVEMDVEPVGEGERGALLHVADEVGGVDLALQLVGGEHHHDIGPFRGIGHAHDLDALAFGLLGRGGAGAQRDGNVLDAGIAHVEKMRMALAAVADDGDLLALDQIEVCVPVVIHAHGMVGPFCWWRRHMRML